MNISHKDKIIWWLPVGTQDKITAEILQKNGFEFYLSDEDRNIFGPNQKYSHDEYIDHQFSNYTLVCNVRNPYERVFDIFCNICFPPGTMEKSQNQNIVKKNFINWINYFFIGKKLVVDLDSRKKNARHYVSLKSFLFKTSVPSIFVRTENLNQDLDRLKFISKESISFLNFRPYTQTLDYKNYYDIEVARKVYNYFFNHFHMIGYNPFSFTNTELTDQQKKEFLHNTF